MVQTIEIPSDEVLTQIQEAFGPCTVMYEAEEVSDLIEDIEEYEPCSLREWLIHRFRIEEADMEGIGMTRAEVEKSMSGIRSRVKLVTAGM